MTSLLLVKHYVCDFVLQTPFHLQHKGQYGHAGGLLHAATHTIGSLLVLVFFPLAWTTLIIVLAGEFVAHYHIDWGKEQILARLGRMKEKPLWNLIGFDQLLHQLTYVAMVAFIYGGP